MNRSSASLLTVILSASLVTPTAAGVVHKWVDANGLTHYSDAPPAIPPSDLTLIELPEPARPADTRNDYYSIQNQWRRIHAERLAREQIRLQQARQAAAKRVEEPSVIYLREPRSRRYALFLPGAGKHAQRRHRFHRPARYYGGYGGKPWRKYHAPRSKYRPAGTQYQ